MGDCPIMTDFVSAGYFITRPRTALPEGYLSVCHDLTDIAPDTWSLDWVTDTRGERQARQAAAEAFGIGADELGHVVRWATDTFGETWDWPYVVRLLDAAQEFCRRFVRVPVRLLGLALPEDLARRFGEVVRRPNGHGVAENLARADRIRAGEGQPRGYEVIGYDAVTGYLHSFRCDNLEVEFQQRFGARFNQFGLIEDETTARACADFSNIDPCCADICLAWLVTEYPTG